MSVRKTKGIVFDFDGTLVTCLIDFGKIKRDILARAQQRNLKIPRGQLPILELLKAIADRNPSGKTSSFLKEAQTLLRKEELASARKSRPLPGAVSLLKTLRRNKYQVAIITRNCRKAVLPQIRKFGFRPDVLLTRDDVARVKPHPEHLAAALRRLGLKPGEALLVGDHPFEIRAAGKLHMTSCAVLSGGKSKEDFSEENPDFVLEDVRGLFPLLGLAGLPAGKLPNHLLTYLLEKFVQNDRSVLVGPASGLDCALLKPRSDLLLAKSDPITLVAEDAGSYLVNINVNDLATMAGRPRWFLTTLIFPVGTTFPQIEKVFLQISAECRKLGINWVGGHTEISGQVKNITAVGLLLGVPLQRKFPKSPVRKGQKLLLVKEIGIEGASIIARERYSELKRAFPERLLEKAYAAAQVPGVGVFKEAALLWKNFPISAMHDPTEGGISTALLEMAQVHRVGFRIEEEKLLFFRPALEFAEYYGLSPLGLISSGCLLVVIPAWCEQAVQRFLKEKRIKASVIGEVVDRRKGVRLLRRGREIPFPEFPADEITRLQM